MAKGGLKKLMHDMKRDDLLVTPKLSRFLASNGDFTIDQSVANRMIGVITDPPADRHSRLSCSSRGTCERAQVFTYIGMPKAYRVEIDGHHIFIDGSWRHIRWQTLLLHLGLLSHVEYTFSMPLFRLRGALDGAQMNDPDPWGFELKGANSYAYKAVLKREGPTERHLMQVHSYMLATRLRRFSMVYENKDTSEWVEYVIEKDPAVMDEVLAELRRLNSSIEYEELPEIIDACKESTDYGCPFRNCCHEATSWQEALNIQDAYEAL